MDDTLKNVVFGLLGLFVVHAALERRASHDATREVRAAFHGTGRVRTAVEARGMFGALGSRFYAVNVYGEGLVSAQLPFAAVPRNGWKGAIRHLRLHFTDLTLKGLPIERFDADIPNVTYDIGQALYKDHLVIRGAGPGVATVRIDAEGLRAFIMRKYSHLLTDVAISFDGQKVVINGRLLVLGAQSPLTASGELEPRDDRYVDLVRPSVELNGKPLSPAVTANTLKQINPVLDLSADVGLARYVKLSRVVIEGNGITIYGRAFIPVGASSP